MRKRLATAASAFLLVAIIFTFLTNVGLPAQATIDDELQAKIEARNKELEKIKAEIAETQKELSSAENQRQTYQGDLKNLDKNINQLTLGIKAAELSINKLDLEIQSLESNIRTTEEEILDKNAYIEKILQEIQFLDSISEVMLFLKSRSLSEGISNIQNLLDLEGKITAEVAVLKNLKNDLGVKVYDRSEKKEEVVLENKNLSYRQTIVKEQKEEKKTLLSFTEKQAAEYNNKLEDLKKKQEEINREIEDIEAELRSRLDLNVFENIGSVLASPVKIPMNNVLTQGYGRTSFSSNYSSGFHNGIDFGIPTGTPLFASENGVVVAVGNQDNYCYRGAYGQFIVIKHPNNQLTTMYAHLSKYVVSPNQQVERGELVGYSGNSGFSTGPHLHFTVYASENFYMGPSRYCGIMPFGAHLNPLDYIKD